MENSFLTALHSLKPTSQTNAHSRSSTSLTDHHGGKGDSLAELPLDELGHEGGEACQQCRLVDLGHDYQQVDGALQRSESNTRKT